MTCDLSGPASGWGIGKWGAMLWGRLSYGQQQNEGDDWLACSTYEDGVDYRLTADGDLLRDPDVHTKCLIRLMTRRGEWFADPDLGSRLHTLQITKNAEAAAVGMVREALQPLLDNGQIATIEFGEFVTNAIAGSFFAEIRITPSGHRAPVTITDVPVGPRSGVDGSTPRRASAPDEPLAIDPDEVTTADIPEQSTGWRVNSTLYGDVDYVLDGDGRLTREASITSRCLVRLLTRRGEWFGDPEIGSLIHTIQITKNAEARLFIEAQRALQPLIDSGEILRIVQTRTERPDNTSVLAWFEIEIPRSAVIEVGPLELATQ